MSDVKSVAHTVQNIDQMGEKQQQNCAKDWPDQNSKWPMLYKTLIRQENTKKTLCKRLDRPNSKSVADAVHNTGQTRKLCKRLSKLNSGSVAHVVQNTDQTRKHCAKDCQDQTANLWPMCRTLTKQENTVPDQTANLWPMSYKH